ncbi:hypothetical protein B0H10DRAFT_745709 [Mycena sp. CBHHK59/15]|nr:hypothetical protein B0H10DRAFT_745709 [Mycena sp. CBHHK59/15]
MRISSSRFHCSSTPSTDSASVSSTMVSSTSCSSAPSLASSLAPSVTRLSSASAAPAGSFFVDCAHAVEPRLAQDDVEGAPTVEDIKPRQHAHSSDRDFAPPSPIRPYCLAVRYTQPPRCRQQVAGDGLALATAVAPANVVMPGLQGNSVVGAVFNPTIDVHALNHAPILSLIRFYNEDFGITLQDTVPIRAQNVTNWLTEPMF